MNIRIIKLTLTNFKCFRDKEITFGDDVTTILGRNGAGKTTISDAILWCLFGKNSEGQSDFDIKTHGEDGKPIPHLDHSVEIVLLVGDDYNAQTVHLKRTLKETWVKKRGSQEQVFKNNSTEYLVNGDSYTATDYKKFISQMIDEDLFKAITNPSYFPSLKWQVQREFLTKMIGNIEPEYIVGNDDDLLALVHTLDDSADNDIISYRKHLSYQIKQIKDKLDKIPVRLSEQHKALPERLDWESLEFELNKAKKELADVEQKIVEIKSGNGDDVRKDEIRKEVEQLKKQAADIEDRYRNEITSLTVERRNQISQLTIKFNSLLNTQKDLENAIKSSEKLKKRCIETAEEVYNSEKTYIRNRWAETQISFDATEIGYCSFCHQPLPADMMDAAREEFNKHKAELKKELTERAEKANKLLENAKKESEQYNNKIQEAEEKLKETKEEINSVFSEKAKLEKEQVPTLEDKINGDADYQTITKRIYELQNELQNTTTSEEDKKVLDELTAKKCVLNDGMDTVKTQLATRSQYDKIQQLINGINEEEKNLIEQLSELERKEDVARRYQDRQNTILEERINEHFSLVKWKLFRTVNNGGDPFDEPFCECYVDGVAYHDGLNQAARLNAGLDIINTLCKHYEVSAPIVIDNAESNLDILHTDSQQIRLQVSDVDLQII